MNSLACVFFPKSQKEIQCSRFRQEQGCKSFKNVKGGTSHQEMAKLWHRGAVCYVNLWWSWARKSCRQSFGYTATACLLVVSVHHNHVRISDPVQLAFVCIGLGLEETTKWLDLDIVGCLQTFFIECTKGEWLKDPEVLFLVVKNRPVCSFWVQSVVLYLSRLEIYGKSCPDNTEQMQWTNFSMVLEQLSLIS